eukprot:scaffold7574_cov68-Phaeocystis_antarctica.AAC.10
MTHPAPECLKMKVLFCKPPGSRAAEPREPGARATRLADLVWALWRLHVRRLARPLREATVRRAPLCKNLQRGGTDALVRVLDGAVAHATQCLQQAGHSRGLLAWDGRDH